MMPSTRDMPDIFFGDYDGGEARSGAFDTIVALRPRGFLYIGDSNIGANYIDLSVSPEAQKIILTCRENFLYEPIKDFALNRPVRSDIWCHGPVSQTTDPAVLFGPFAYGIVMAEDRIPTEIKAPGKTVDLSVPIFKKLIGLMTLMPISIGDFLAHPDGKGPSHPPTSSAPYRRWSPAASRPADARAFISLRSQQCCPAALCGNALNRYVGSGGSFGQGNLAGFAGAWRRNEYFRA